MVILENSWTLNMIKELLLQRFRCETGDNNAESVQWDLLDTSMIPLKYSNIIINESTISEPRFFRNPEIVNNIHFIHPMIKKRKLDTVNERDFEDVRDIDDLSEYLLDDEEQNH